jgi:hypothetical protein
VTSLQGSCFLHTSCLRQPQEAHHRPPSGGAQKLGSRPAVLGEAAGAAKGRGEARQGAISRFLAGDSRKCAAPSSCAPTSDASTLTPSHASYPQEVATSP